MEGRVLRSISVTTEYCSLKGGGYNGEKGRKKKKPYMCLNGAKDPRSSMRVKFYQRRGLQSAAWEIVK